MRRGKKLVALMMVLMFSATALLTGCKKPVETGKVDTGKQEDAGKQDTGKDNTGKQEGPINLTIYSQTANYSGEQIGWFAKVMLDKFNVKITIVNDTEGVFITRMESGNLGDIVIFGGDSDDYLEAIDKGMLYDWNDDDLLDEYGPYIKENMEKALEKNAGLSPDGKVYGFGFNVASSAEDHEAFFYHPDIRWDLYAQLGYPEVKTLEDYIDVLAKMKELCPTSESGKETFGVSLFNDWDGDMVMFVKATGALYGFDEFGVGLYDVENQVWQGSMEDGGMYLRALAFYNKLYQRNLLDPDSMTQGYDGASEDYQDGVAFFSIFNYMASLLYNTDDHLAAGKAMYALAAEDAKTLNYGLNVYGSSRVWTIGAKTQYPELCMEIINWLSTPEGRMVSEYGPQGVTWDYDTDGKAYFTDLGLACRADKKTEMKDGYTGTFGDGTNQMNNITWSLDAANPDSNGETYNYLNWASYNAREATDIQKDWRSHTGFTTQDEYLQARTFVIAPGTTYSMSSKSEELSIVWEQVKEAIKNYSWQAIYAKNDDEFASVVKEMQQKVNEYGYEQCAEFCRKEAEIRKAKEIEVMK